MKLLAQILLILTLASGIGLDMAAAATDVGDVHAATVVPADIASVSDATDGTDGGDWQPEISSAPHRCVDAPVRDGVTPCPVSLPFPYLPSDLRPPIGPRLA